MGSKSWLGYKLIIMHHVLHMARMHVQHAHHVTHYVKVVQRACLGSTHVPDCSGAVFLLQVEAVKCQPHKDLGEP